MPGRSGYTGEGGDSIMSWPHDEASSTNKMDPDLDDPGYLWYQDKSTQWEAEKMYMQDEIQRSQLEVARQRTVIQDLQGQVCVEKKSVKKLRTAKIQDESLLAYQDIVIEEMEQDAKEYKKKDVEQQYKIKEYRFLIVKMIRILVAMFTFLIAISVVCCYMYFSSAT